jgi:hypothetical protein
MARARREDLQYELESWHPPPVVNVRRGPRTPRRKGLRGAVRSPA